MTKPNFSPEFRLETAPRRNQTIGDDNDGRANLNTLTKKTHRTY
jgi:hypothetical protein